MAGSRGSPTSAPCSAKPATRDPRPRATRAVRLGPGQSASPQAVRWLPIWQDRGLVTSGPCRRLCTFALTLSGWALPARFGHCLLPTHLKLKPAGSSFGTQVRRAHPVTAARSARRVQLNQPASAQRWSRVTARVRRETRTVSDAQLRVFIFQRAHAQLVVTSCRRCPPPNGMNTGLALFQWPIPVFGRQTWTVL